MGSTVVLVTLLGGFSAWYLVRRRRVLQLGVFFNILAVCYFVFGMAVARTSLGAYGFELDRIGWMCVAAVAGFNLAYLAAGARSGRASVRVSGYLPSHSTLVVVAGVALMFEAAAILLIGPFDFLLSDRLQRFAAVQPRVALFYFANFINVCLPILLARYLAYGQRRDLRLLWFLIVHGVLFGLVTISRYDLMIVVLSCLFFLESARKIRPLTVACIVALALVSTVFFKPVMYDLLLATEYRGPVDAGEYTNWIRHTVLLLTRPDVELPAGNYLLTLKSLFVMSPEEDALSEWFFNEFFPERALLFPGLGYGFSGVLEGYAANGLFGVAMHFAFFGAFFGWLERSPAPMRKVFTLFALILGYRLFRSEAYNFVKTYAWYFAYPAIAIVVADKFLNWASASSPAAQNR